MSQQFKCHACDAPAVRACCLAGEPWVPYCAEHEPTPWFEKAGDISISQLPKSLEFLRAVFRKVP